MSLRSGTRLGVFEVVAKIGEGGMGQVYRARDTKLGRDVALKVLPELFTSDPERLARFEREAKVLASLNHPNIAQVFGFEAPSAGSGHGHAIAMELVEGPTLDELLRAPELGAADGPASVGLPLDRALAIVRQIAAALEAAHDQGIVHRDLKPSNVKVREDGTVKVLDFGLAKAMASDDPASGSGLSNSPTLTARSTQLGMILGTAAYMAPEQAKGRAVDRRADVWAFGALFFEVLSGRRAFDGDDVSEVLAAVLKTDPDWSALPDDLPEPVRRLLRRCLVKDPKKRLRDVAEGLVQMDEGLTAPSEVPGSKFLVPGSPRPLWRRALPIAVTALVTGGIVFAVLTATAPPPPSPPAPGHFQFFPSPPFRVFSTGSHHDVAMSPDGRTMALLVSDGQSPPRIALRPMDSLEVTPLRGAEGAVLPFFSHDSEWVGFLDQADQTIVRKVSVLGGPSVQVAKFPAQIIGATWTRQGEIVVGVREGVLHRVPEAGGEPVAVTALDDNAKEPETSHLWPAAVPGTRLVLFTAVIGAAPPIAGGRISVINLDTGAVTRLGLAGAHPRYVPSGHIVYGTEDGSLRAVPFDTERVAVTGDPAPVLENVAVKLSGAANFDVSDDGHLVYLPGVGAASVERTLTWVDRTGKETAINAPARAYFYARISPDGRKLSLDVRDAEEDIWIWDLARETFTRLTDRAGADQYGLWTPDSQRIVFASPGGIRMELFQHRIDGIGQPTQVTDTAEMKLVPFPNAITPDGKQVIFRSGVGGPVNDLFIAPIEGEGSVRALFSSPHDERNAAISPDGRFIVFESNLSSRWEVYVRPFPDVNAGQEQVSTSGGEEPVWSPRGDEIFYLAGNGTLMAVPVTTTPKLTLGRPVPLFKANRYFFGGVGRNYDVSGDGRRFVMVVPPESQAVAATSPATVVLNWMAELSAKLR